MSRRRRAAETTGGSDEREARFLSVPLAHFDLVDESARLRAEQEYVEGDRNGRTLAKVGAFRLVLVAFRVGANFDERDQRGSVALQVLGGRVAVRVDDESVEIGAAEIVVIRARTPVDRDRPRRRRHVDSSGLAAGARFRHELINPFGGCAGNGVVEPAAHTRRIHPLFIPISAAVQASLIWSLMEPWETKADHRAFR